MTQPRAELLLYRHAEVAWLQVVRPWLEAGRDTLSRSSVVVPTRAQAAVWKLRCLDAGLPLIGVEFLTPGLARQKWLALGMAGEVIKPVLGREFLLHGLRLALEEEIDLLPPGHEERGILETLRSDAEAALNDFDELQRAGFGPAAFEWPAVQRVFQRLESWTASLGYEASVDQVRRALVASGDRRNPLDGRVLFLGLSAESWGEWGNMAVLARCFPDVTVVLPEPEFRGKNHLDEAWVEAWERWLGVGATSVEPAPQVATAGAAADEWLSGDSVPDAAGVISASVGRTRGDEVLLAVERVAGWLSSGAERVALVVPSAGPTAFRLAARLRELGIQFQDTTGLAGAPSAETQAQRALLAFFSTGSWDAWFGVVARFARMNETRLRETRLRDRASRLFDELQNPSVAAYEKMIQAGEDETSRELAAFLQRVPVTWPERMTLGVLVGRVKDVFVSLQTGVPPGWEALEAFAAKDPRSVPTARLWPLLDSFLPTDGPSSDVGAASGFSRVVLTTRRRAEGVPWTHVLLVEANAGIWPLRAEPSCWLGEERRRELSRVEGVASGLLTSDDKAALEKAGYASLARNAQQVHLTAALQDERDPETILAPNSWLERVLWRENTGGEGEAASKKLEEWFAAAAVSHERTVVATEDVRRWHGIWMSRRDPCLPFDDYFHSVSPAEVKLEKIAARVAEAGVQDPAVLWYSALLRLSRVERRPFERTRKKWLGQRAHAILADALKTPAVEGHFGPRPDFARVRDRAEGLIASLSSSLGSNLYWKSCYSELRNLVGRLLDKVEALPARDFLAVELPLPVGTRLLIGHPDRTLELHGRVDLVLSDRPHWEGATVEIVDFKTGSDGNLSVERLQRGHSLQLALYLAAAQGLGIRDGRVTMVKPDDKPSPSLSLRDLPDALTSLARLDRHVETGRYGALTEPPSDFAASLFEAPLASVPIAHDLLERKWNVTFPEAEASE